MALIAWYPLNGDILDYSGNGNHLKERLSNGHFKTSNEGKTGKCLERLVVNDSGSDLQSINKVNLNKDITLSAWVRVSGCHAATANGIFGTHEYSKNQGFGITIKHVSDSDFRISCSTGNGTSRTYTSYFGTTNIKDVWANLTTTYDSQKKTVKLFVNGIEEFSVPYALFSPEDYISVFNWSTNWGSASYRPAFKINDARIYDHVLSAREMREISKAKVLHYAFDDYQEPTENYGDISNPRVDKSYLPFVATNSGNWKANHINAIRVYNSKGSEISNYTNSGVTDWTNTHHAIWEFDEELKKPVVVMNDLDGMWKSKTFDVGNSMSGIGLGYGDKYTMSWLQWTDNLSKSANTGFYSKNISGVSSFHDGQSNSKIESYNSEIRKWQRVSATFVVTNSVDLNSQLRIYMYGYYGGRGTIKISDFQLEKKDHPTPFTPNSRAGRIFDSSGYGNNSTLSLATTPTWVKDSALGTGAYKFDGVNNSMTLGYPKSFAGFTNCTISFWRKNDTTITHWLPFTGHTNSHYLMATSAGTGAFYHANAGSPKIYKDGVYAPSATPFTDQKWHHYVIKNVNLSAWNAFKLSDYGNVWSCEGYFDDIRLYNTELSDNDIKELYESKANLSNNGDLCVFGIDERVNLASPLNGAVSSRTFTNGLSSYAQGNCQVTLTERGYRIHRPPNLVYPDAGNTMWGGLKICLFNIDKDILKKGHRYKISFDVTGQSSNPVGAIYFTNQMGWGGGGLSSVSPANAKSIPNEFQGSMEVSAEFHITDDIWKICTTSYSSFVAGQSYNCYRDLAWGFHYTSTGSLGTDIYLTNFRVIDITESKGFDLSSRGIITANNINEIGLPVRYIREAMNGSTTNIENHWVEIQAYDESERNVALGKAASNALITDGATATSPYNSISPATVDLGDIYKISYLKVWHYYGDGRTYRNIKTEVSANGTEWITVFDSDIDGEYAESDQGKIILLRPNRMTIDSKGNLYVREIKEVEI